MPVHLVKNWIARIKGPGHEELRTPRDEAADFQLTYDSLIVGELWLFGGMWHFEYSDEFREQAEIMPLPEFPDVHKRYQSEDLWPFFEHRIPSLRQPAVQQIIKNEEIDEHNIARLLKRFGESTISNPFRLRDLEAV